MNTYWYTAECLNCKKEYSSHKLVFATGLCRKCMEKERETDEKESICRSNKKIRSSHNHDRTKTRRVKYGDN